MDKIDRDRLIELWVKRLRARTEFETGYYQGRFEEYAAQNAIDPDEYLAIRAEAYEKVFGAAPPFAGMC